MKRNGANPLLEFDIYTEDGEIMVFISIMRFGKIFKTGFVKNV